MTPVGMDDAVPGRPTSSTSAAARTASRRSSRPTSPRKGPALREAVAGGAAVLAVCGGYQLLGRFYRDRSGAELPGVGLLPLHTVAGERRMIGDVLLDCALGGRARSRASRTTRAGRVLDDGAEPLGRVVSGFGNDGASGQEGCRMERVYGTYLHGPLLPRNPWLADRLLAEALAPTRPARSRSSPRSRTSWSKRRTRSPHSGRGSAAAASEFAENDPVRGRALAPVFRSHV